MSLYLSITAITLLLLGISFLLESATQWTAWLMVCALWAVLSAAILIPGGPLRSHDVAQMAPKTPAQCSTEQHGELQRPSDTRSSLPTHCHKRVARHSGQPAGNALGRLVVVIGIASQGREWIARTLRRNSGGRRFDPAVQERETR